MIGSLAAIHPTVTATGIVLFLAICVILILVVLIQRPQGGGLGGAFGGGAAGSGQTAFGARTGDVLTWITIGLFVAFLTIAALLNFAVLPPQAEVRPTLTAAPGSPEDVPAPGSTSPLNQAPPSSPADLQPPQPLDSPAAPQTPAPQPEENPGGGDQ